MKKIFGFTLIEVLIVISILALLAMGVFFSVSRQRMKADDARAKADLALLKIAFENYYNDHGCYPPADWFDSQDDCGSNKLMPYLNTIPCDHNTGLPYVLETDATACVWFKLYATFDLPGSDEQALAQRSATGSKKGSYGVSSSNVTVTVYSDPNTSSPISSPTPTPTSTPTPPPTPSPVRYFCLFAGPGNGIPGNCNTLSPGQTCTPTYSDPNCGADHCAGTTSTCY